MVSKLCCRFLNSILECVRFFVVISDPILDSAGNRGGIWDFDLSILVSTVFGEGGAPSGLVGSAGRVKDHNPTLEIRFLIETFSNFQT